MQKVSEVMTREVRFVAPQDSLQRAAQLMDELNVGALPVCNGQALVGMVTDRDITVRATATGKLPRDTRVEEVMSKEVRWCFEDQPLDEVMRQMAERRVRRIPVISHDDRHRLIGIVALGDVATRSPRDVRRHNMADVVEQVSSPTPPERAHGGAAGGKDLQSIAPAIGTSAGPGSTESISQAAGETLAAPAGGGTRGNMVDATNAPTSGMPGRQGDANPGQ